MKPTRIIIPLASVLLGFIGMEPGASQSPGGLRNQPSESAGNVSGKTMVFEREVFIYPAGERRNPFLPVGDLSADGPRVEDTRLLGIIHHPDSAYSLVVLGVSGGLGGPRDTFNAEAGPERGWATARLRLGGVLGSLRIVQIHEDHVVIEVDQPGGIAKQVLAIPRPVVGR